MDRQYLTSWTVLTPEGRATYTRNAETGEWTRTEWVDTKAYTNPAALLKGELGRLEGFSKF